MIHVQTYSFAKWLHHQKEALCCCCCIKGGVQSSSHCLLLIFKKETMLCALNYKRHSSRLPAQQRQVRIPLRYFSEDNHHHHHDWTLLLYVALMWIDKLLFDSFWTGSKIFFVPCAIVEHVDFEPIGWTKFVPFHVASASQINKKSGSKYSWEWWRYTLVNIRPPDWSLVVMHEPCWVHIQGIHCRFNGLFN